MAVYDRAAFEAVIGASLKDIKATFSSFEVDGVTMLSPASATVIAELACRTNPMPVLKWVTAEEVKCRDLCKRGGKRDGLNHEGVWKKDQSTSPEYEYHLYRQYERPQHELLRQWCGHRAVTFQERLTAAESEVRRLDILVATLIDALKTAPNAKNAAEAYEREHNEERIRPEAARPVVDRPLAPWEMPVREIRVRGRRWR